MLKIWSSFWGTKRKLLLNKYTHIRKRRSTHSKHTNAHTELSQRNHLFPAPSMKEDTAVEQKEEKGREEKTEGVRGRERVVVRAGVCKQERETTRFQWIWIEFNSRILNNCMSSSCHGKPRQLCWRPPRLTASTLPSQAEEVMSRGRTPGLAVFPVS